MIKFNCWFTHLFLIVFTTARNVLLNSFHYLLVFSLNLLYSTRYKENNETHTHTITNKCHVNVYFIPLRTRYTLQEYCSKKKVHGSVIFTNVKGESLKNHIADIVAQIIEIHTMTRIRQSFHSLKNGKR